MDESDWHDVGAAAELATRPLTPIKINRTPIALSCVNGQFSAISGVCNHVGGPLGEGLLDGEYVVCPWHQYKFHCKTGEGEPGFEDDRVPSHETRVEGGRVMVNLTPATKRHKVHHDAHPLARPTDRAPGPPRVAGISTTAMDLENPRYSGSDDLLATALSHASGTGAETRLIKLNALKFRSCEGYYSKAARACTWPCTITQMDETDQLDQVYEALGHWADVVLISTPIRWGAASALYFKMAERMNCIQNQITTHDRVLIKNKVVSFLIVGGQDNVQAVAGQMLAFFSELGFLFPQFPFVAHSRGWTAEDMEKNVATVKKSEELHQGARELTGRALALSARLLATNEAGEGSVARGGRKAHRLRDVVEES